MARKREVLIDEDEDIVYYEHSITGKFVRVMVGIGTKMADGSFVAADNQNFENVIIEGQNYDNLMSANGNKPLGVFRKDDLWDFVDIGRAKFLTERSQLKEKIELELLANNPQNVES